MTHPLEPVFFAGFLVSTIGSIVVAYLSYDIYKYNRHNRAWLAVTLGFILTVLVRVFEFSEEFEWLSSVGEHVIQLWLLTTILFLTGLWIFGFWHMRKSFSQFQVMGQQADVKLDAFKKSMRRK
ncbi:MAG: hypothetical protein AABY13_00835, partial [Nanoarchaeota archaeon]